MGWAAPLLVTAQPSSVSAGWASGVGHVSRGLLELIGHVLAQFRPALNSGFFGGCEGFLCDLLASLEGFLPGLLDLLRYGHMLPESEGYLRELLNSFDLDAEAEDGRGVVDGAQ
jgi:hypothetical protein